jgi:hypothetical protein
VQIEWAHECAPPDFAKARRLRGSKALGLTYERKLARVLPKGTRHGQWFAYCVDGKVRFCQPDFLLVGRSELAVLEAKLADVTAASEQLRGLYVPVLKAAYGKRVLPVIVARSLSRLPENADIDEVCCRLIEALDLARAGRLPVLHWIGRGGL